MSWQNHGDLGKITFATLKSRINIGCFCNTVHEDEHFNNNNKKIQKTAMHLTNICN